jgi:hypothetical protein
MSTSAAEYLRAHQLEDITGLRASTFRYWAAHDETAPPEKRKGLGQSSWVAAVSGSASTSWPGWKRRKESEWSFWWPCRSNQESRLRGGP